MVTLNQLKKTLELFFDRHRMINTTVVSNVLDFKAIPSIDYPVAHIEAVEGTSTDKGYIQGFVVTIADIMDMQLVQRGVPELHNDCLQIAQDFMTYFSDDDFELFELNRNNSYQFFEEDNTDRIAGITFRINLNTYNGVNRCAVQSLLNNE